MIVLVMILLLYMSSSRSYVCKHQCMNRLSSIRNQYHQLNSMNEERMIKLFEDTFEKVVYISTLQQAFNPLTFNFVEIDSQSGSGFVWNNTGMVVTNYHVIEQSYKSKSDVMVTFLGNEKSRNAFRAKIYGVDPKRDIAVLKIDDIDGISNMKEKSIPLGNSKDLKVGQTAIAIGTPFGLDSTMTTGIISGLGRTIKSGVGGSTIFNGIQVDCAINPGNSGGPLLDSSGRLIGMNTAIYSTTGSFSGIGFAIPIDLLKVIVNALILDRKIVRKPTGLNFLGGRQSKSLGITTGLAIVTVDPGSPAEKAGLRGLSRNSNSLLNISLGDVIIKVNGIRVDSEEDFMAAIDQNIKGDTVELRVLRLVKSNDNTPKSIETTIKLQLT